MERKKFRYLLATIWALLIIKAVFEWDWLSNSHVSGASWTRSMCAYDGIIGTCTNSVLIYELANSIFWGIMATVALYSLIDIEDDEEE